MARETQPCKGPVECWHHSLFAGHFHLSKAGRKFDLKPSAEKRCRTGFAGLPSGLKNLGEKKFAFCSCAFFSDTIEDEASSTTGLPTGTIGSGKGGDERKRPGQTVCRHSQTPPARMVQQERREGASSLID